MIKFDGTGRKLFIFCSSLKCSQITIWFVEFKPCKIRTKVVTFFFLSRTVYVVIFLLKRRSSLETILENTQKSAKFTNVTDGPMDERTEFSHCLECIKDKPYQYFTEWMYSTRPGLGQYKRIAKKECMDSPMNERRNDVSEKCELAYVNDQITHFAWFMQERDVPIGRQKDLTS